MSILPDVDKVFVVGFQVTTIGSVSAIREKFLSS
jgi:hypothetical protein